MGSVTDRNDPNFNVNALGALPGRRRCFELTVLGMGNEEAYRAHSYPEASFRTADAIYFASPSLVYTVVPSEEPNGIGFSGIGWTSLGNIRLWGALAFSIVEGKGFSSFYPLADRMLYSAACTTRAEVQRVAERVAAEHKPQSPNLHWVKPKAKEVAALYEALLQADNVLLRGVNCYLKAHLLWGFGRSLTRRWESICTSR